MPHYAQLYEQVGESKDIGLLLETNPLAASLFVISLARADLYGILPGDPRDYRTRVCPAAAVPVAEVEKALAVLAELHMYLPYEANEKRYIYVMQYHAYQQVRWDRTGRPGTPLPRAWSVPHSLKEELTKEGEKTPAYFGLTNELAPLPESSWNSSGLTIRWRKSRQTGPGVVQESAGSSTGRLPTSSVSASVSASTDSENDSALPAEDAALKEPKQKKTRPAQASLGGTESANAARSAERAAWGENTLQLWQYFGLPDKPGKSVYALGTKVQKRDGPEAFLRYMKECPLQDAGLPEGADPEAWFLARMQDALRYKCKWRGQEKTAGQRWMVGPNGEKLYERDWNYDCRSWYDACVAGGTWDFELGLATSDSRHPSSPLYQQGKEAAGD